MRNPAHDQSRELTLDALRAVAISMVLGYHLFPDLMPLGYLGVDVFFVLSGVFIARQMGHRNAAPLPYLWKRALRLWPATIAMLAGVLALGWFVLLPHEYMRLARDGLIALGFASNLVAVTPGGYFGPDAVDLPFLHMWSVSVEAQVYLACALALPILLRLAALPWLLFVVGGVSLAYNITFADNMDLYFDPLARGWQFALGAAAGAWRGKIPHSPDAARPIIAILLFGACLPSSSGSMLSFALAASSLAAAYIILVSDSERPARLPLRLGAWVGRASFGTYLWHWPLIVLADHALFVERSVPLSLGIGFASILLGWLSLRLVEAPARTLTAPSLPRAAGVVIPGFIIAVIAIGLVAGQGIPDRLPPPARAILAQTQPAHDRLLACHVFPGNPASGFPITDACRHNTDLGLVRTAVLGDSHSGSLAGGLMRNGLPFVEYSYSGCAPTTTLYPEHHGPACPERTEQAITAILADPQIETVIIAARWAFYTQPPFDNGRGGREWHPEVFMRDIATGVRVSDLRVRSEMRNTMLRLLDAGKTVIAVGPTPVFGWDIKMTAARSAWHQIPVDLEVSLGQMDRRQSAMIEMLRGIEAQNYRFVDPRPLFCDMDTCRAVASDGVLLFEDQDHLSQAGADLLSRLVLKLP